MEMIMIFYHYLEEKNIQMTIDMSIIQLWEDLVQKCQLLQKINMMN